VHSCIAHLESAYSYLIYSPARKAEYKRFGSIKQIENADSTKQFVAEAQKTTAKAAAAAMEQD
jgi:hypothetical protein